MISLLNKGILYRFKTESESTVVIADITKVTEGISISELSAYSAGHSRERALQMACADILVSIIIDQKAGIKRTKKGAPFLENHPYKLSISHTSQYMAMIVSSKGKVAIDIEIKGRNIDRLKSRFTSDKEVEMILPYFQKESLLCNWGIKECLFKIIPTEGVLFKEHLIIDGTSNNNGHLETHCRINHPNLKAHFNVISRIFEPLILSYIDATPHAKSSI